MSTLSGKAALAEIDSMLAAARDRLSTTQSQFSSARSRLAAVQHQEIGIYAELAKLRLLAIEGGELLDALGSADRTVADVLAEREAAAKRLDETIDAANESLGNHESRREEQREAVAAASDALDAAQGEAQSKLEASDAWQAQLRTTEKADFVADQQQMLKELSIVSELKVIERQGFGDLEPVQSEEVEGLLIGIRAASGEKCERCWIRSETVGQMQDHPTICSRCFTVIDSLNS